MIAYNEALLHCKCFDHKNYGDWKLRGYYGQNICSVYCSVSLVTILKALSYSMQLLEPAIIYHTANTSLLWLQFIQHYLFSRFFGIFTLLKSRAALACSFDQELKIPPPGFFFRVKCTHRCSHAKESHILYALLYNRLSPSVSRTIKRLGSHISVQYYNSLILLSFNERH